MSTVQALPGSFRDPSGHVYEVDARIFRTVTDYATTDFDFVCSTGLLQKLTLNGLVLPFEKVDQGVLGPIGKNAGYVLEAPRIPWISFPYEWPFSSLKAAALLHLEIHATALEHGVTLSDASAYNVQFYGVRPIFIDHLSFRRYKPGEFWTGHRQFCEQFLNPLLLRAFLGIPHNAWYRGSQEGIETEDLCRLLKWRNFFSSNVLSQVLLQSYFQRSARRNIINLKKEHLTESCLPLASLQGLIKKLHRWISRLKPLDTGKTIWQNYADFHNYPSKETDLKRQFILDFVRQTQPKLLWDLGCNTGTWGAVALENGAEYVVGFDSDHGALEKTFARSHEGKLLLQPLYMDAANPSPNQGWMGRERPSLEARASADAVLALAFVHHLVIARNIPFIQLLNWILDLAPNGVIEFVPKSDSNAQVLLHLREDIFPDYTEECFLSHIAQRAEIIKTKTLPSSGRILVWYARRR